MSRLMKRLPQLMAWKAAPLPFHLLGPQAERRIARGSLDLPDVCAERRKDLAGERRRSAVTPLDHHHTVKRKVMHC
ncbi:hypothetical protein RR42_s0833 [Cupriavidus basilensis]|uniref:Uncharacterized protein n=1 Tax=Cupriavidus basilensis TaxID=68895 RepID=A0A0C4YHF5_9BURK|nr:hypothetical protein RR42_s0833 [Cupriavidus basilensis]